MSKEISDERKVMFYIGTGLQILGGLLFVSTFISFAIHFGDFSNFELTAKSTIFGWVGGMALLFIGAAIRNLGARGLAGSGVILDPERARFDLEPYSRMTGGIVKDVLDEANVNLGTQPTKVIMLKCRECATLNQVSAKYCQECGKEI